MTKFKELFGCTPILGMIHLAGEDKVKLALEEIAIYASEGVDGVIVEDYHGSPSEVVKTLEAIDNPGLIIGVNILRRDYDAAVETASMFNAKFIQIDQVAGNYQGHRSVDAKRYDTAREQFPSVLVLGGVWPKYHEPVSGDTLDEDLEMGVRRTDAVVVTGAGTGKETPMDKIRTFREKIGDHPLIIGAGLTSKTVYNQLIVADGAIVGSYFKPEANTERMIDRYLVRDFMHQVKIVRKLKAGKEV